MKLTTAALSLATCVLTTMAAAQEEIRPTILYDLGGKFDRSFNENAYNGANRFSKETGISLMEFEPQTEAQRVQAVRTFAEQGGSPIVAAGYAWQPALEEIAPQFPDTKFAIIDTVIDLPNVQSIEFAYNEGSFVVGALAAMVSKTGKIGFVGGMDIPIIRDFSCGYLSGARFVDPEIEFVQNMVGTTGAAWSDPARGRELTIGQFEQGADIVHGAAGGTTTGVLQAAADTGNLAIGVGSNQNYLQPGSVLTTNYAALDVAVYGVFEAAMNGTWKPGTVVLGLADGGVGWSLDEHNRDLVNDEQIARLDEIIAGVVAGEIEVPSYLASGTCPHK